MDVIDIKPGITADSPDSDGDICINIEADYHGEERYVYLNKEQVEKLLSLFD
ncbi:conserved hypothetical protein [Vibrio phage 199E37-1]|nr:conserved hypothetical protein [Vibrio phage 199E37-1]